jgi:phage-related protein
MWSLDSNEFLSQSLRHYSEETFLAAHTFNKIAKKPLFEAISLRIPTGPPKIKNIQKMDSMQMSLSIVFFVETL